MSSLIFLSEHCFVKECDIVCVTIDKDSNGIHTLTVRMDSSKFKKEELKWFHKTEQEASDHFNTIVDQMES